MSNHSQHSPILPCKWQQPKVNKKWLGSSSGIWCPGFLEGIYLFQKSKKPTKNTRSSLPASGGSPLLVQLLLSSLATDVCLWLQFEFGELICCLIFRLFSACRRLLKVITDHLPKVGKLLCGPFQLLGTRGPLQKSPGFWWIFLMKQLLDWFSMSLV